MVSPKQNFNLVRTYQRVSTVNVHVILWPELVLDLRAPQQPTHLAVSVLHEFLYTIKQITDQQLLPSERINYYALY